ncbi:MAG TPA: MBL fold metallo-hydrolase [Dehalococcoidales bacterium]
MVDSSYRFRLGKFECMVVHDGSLKVPGPPTHQSGGISDMENGEIMDVSCLYINTGSHKVLIDTGCGSLFQAGTGKLVKNLTAAGIGLNTIEMIIHTHGHLDHVAGSFSDRGEAVFPNARYIVAKTEWECWESPRERAELQPLFTAARKYYLPRREHFTLVEDGSEVLPGITLTITPGHTPGSTMLTISAGGEKLVCIGDMIHSAREFEQPDYYGFLDFDPELAIKTRNKVLSEMQKSNRLVFACHFPFPGIGHIIKNGNRLGWRAVDKN